MLHVCKCIAVHCLWLILRCLYSGPYGLWTDHVLGWWKHKDDANVLYLKYEDVKKVLEFCNPFNFKKSAQKSTAPQDNSDKEISSVVESLESVICRAKSLNHNLLSVIKNTYIPNSIKVALGIG